MCYFFTHLHYDSRKRTLGKNKPENRLSIPMESLFLGAGGWGRIVIQQYLKVRDMSVRGPHGPSIWAPPESRLLS